jgi:glycosyltransferase involved in cell wall biosynthesis
MSTRNTKQFDRITDKQSLKIAVIGHSLYPIAEPFAGGLEKFTHELCSELIQRGHQVHLYAHPESDPELGLQKYPKLKYDIYDGENATGNQPEEFPNEAYLAQTELYSKFLNTIKNGEYDIVHNNSLNDMAMIKGNEIGMPFLTTLHTPPFPSLQNGAIAIKDDCRIEFTAVSDSLGATWSEFIPDSKTVYNGSDMRSWTFNPYPKERHAFWYGRICKEKAPHHAILAAKKSGMRLRLAGPISDKYYFQNFVADYLDDPDITYIGHKSQKELDYEIGASELVYFTSIWDEPFGFVLTEAQACGTPVIGYDSGAASEIIGRDTGVLVSVGDIEALAEASMNVSEISRRACRARVEEFFSLDRMISSYETLYRDVIIRYGLGNNSIEKRLRENRENIRYANILGKRQKAL